MRYENVSVMRHQTRPQLCRTKLQSLQIRLSLCDRLFLLLLLLPLRRAGELFTHHFVLFNAARARDSFLFFREKPFLFLRGE